MRKLQDILSRTFNLDSCQQKKHSIEPSEFSGCPAQAGFVNLRGGPRGPWTGFPRDLPWLDLALSIRHVSHSAFIRPEPPRLDD